MLINLNEFINHNTTVNILLATIQNMAESPKCLYNVLIITVTARASPVTGWLFSATLPLSPWNAVAQSFLSTLIVYTHWWVNHMNTVCGINFLHFRHASSSNSSRSQGPTVLRELPVRRAWYALSMVSPRESWSNAPGNLIKEQSAKRNGVGVGGGIHSSDKHGRFQRRGDLWEASYRCQV